MGKANILHFYIRIFQVTLSSRIILDGSLDVPLKCRYGEIAFDQTLQKMIFIPSKHIFNWTKV